MRHMGAGDVWELPGDGRGLGTGSEACPDPILEWKYDIDHSLRASSGTGAAPGL